MPDPPVVIFPMLITLHGNLLILVDGIALDSGMKGDYLKVKNENSGKIIKGWVKNNKKITIFR